MGHRKKQGAVVFEEKRREHGREIIKNAAASAESWPAAFIFLYVVDDGHCCRAGNQEGGFGYEIFCSVRSRQLPLILSNLARYIREEGHNVAIHKVKNVSRMGDKILVIRKSFTSPKRKEDGLKPAIPPYRTFHHVANVILSDSCVNIKIWIL